MIRAEGIVSVLAVPIRIGNHVEGVIYLANRAPRSFTDRDEAILRAARVLGIHRATLYRKLLALRLKPAPSEKAGQIECDS